MVAGVIAGAGSAGTSGLAGGKIVYAGVDPQDGQSDVYVVKADGSGKTNLTDDDAARKDVSPELSRDGSSIVFVRHAAQGGTRLMIVKANGSGLMDVTPTKSEVGTIAEPSWSPDGNQIVFASNADGNFELYTLDLRTSATSQLTRTLAPVQNLDPAWSPTGKAIVFSRSGLASTSGAASLYQLRLGATAPARLTKTTGIDGDVDPVYSPDGRQIAFSSDRIGNDDVFLLDLLSFSVTKLTATKDRDVQPSFAPDGSALVYVSDRSGATELWAQSLMTVTPGVTNALQLTSDGASKSHPSWGPEVAQPAPVSPPAAATTKSPPMPPVAVAPPAAESSRSASRACDSPRGSQAHAFRRQPGPRLTTKFTFVPTANTRPARGFCEAIRPRARLDHARRMRPTEQCATRIIRRARSSVLPMSRGTLHFGTGGAVVETTSVPMIDGWTSHLNV
jgi:TolB protein